ncbi:Gfo/Idh/MocA family oxidoreductase [Sphingobium sp.]|uniref:Gfo/Idh/MocA family protein n=1 Tax=Sphingobium sp. TaxID=1912891 RepID=UPI0028BEF150|nr:Gfo/Idh/MocA family oxidoreductase [Sphingobium sp.]
MKPVRFALVGGGPGAFIGPVHRLAAELDRELSLVAGAFSSDASRSREAGERFGIASDRAYPTMEAMLKAEAMRPDGIEMVAIATPNHLHFAQARAALEAGLGVMSDKPATATLAEARALAEVIERTGGHYGLTFTYTGYPMIREARARIAAGEIGRVRKVMVEYLQGWLAQPVEAAGNKQAAWRVDPAKAGVGGCIGDIGVHAFNLAEFVVGDTIAAINADLAAVVADRQLDDDATVLLRFAGGARGLLAASQIATGERNNLRLRVYGEKGSIAWSHEACDRLVITGADSCDWTIWAGSADVGEHCRMASRLPAGHPEGYFEAFANLYRDFARSLRGETTGLLPGSAEGLRSMAFVETAVAGNGAGWKELLS